MEGEEGIEEERKAGNGREELVGVELVPCEFADICTGKVRTRGLVSLLAWTTVTAPMMASAIPTISLVRNRSPRIMGAKIQFAINAFFTLSVLETKKIIINIRLCPGELRHWQGRNHSSKSFLLHQRRSEPYLATTACSSGTFLPLLYRYPDHL